ncbi:16S rRNA (cytosine(1402)-N(4))-methyltransferase RsmH, partial [Candidatus Wolfebacteria bacterium]|nr:16S rRNA (cytosine(1402)-N(4))-methyltransferase RsmH [Candidatus Wolfebacteria bacterium]
MSHTPVLLKETIEILDPKPGEFFIDGTIGNGGHSKEILKRIGPNGKLLGIDWDKNAIAKLQIAELQNCKNLILLHGNYADLPKILKNLPAGRQGKKLGKANGLLLDLGFSSEQLESGRGFSFLKDEPLDMRYNAKSQISNLKSQNNLTAAEVINQFSEKDLADIIFKYGEERFSRRIAKAITEQRKIKRILGTFNLVEIIKKAVPKSYERGRIHPATRTFQALRIYVNNELKNLENLLKNIDKIVKNEGRIAIISFHSLEDRLVKNRFKELKNEGKAVILTKKPITAGDEEIKNNPRSRSAKLRAIKII